MRRSKQLGFSLIELLIVVAIILIIAAIAIPNLLRARIAANEASAANTIRQIVSAEINYYNTYPAIGYAPLLTNLGGTLPCGGTPALACMLDDSVAQALPGTKGKQGYQFQATGLSSAGVNAAFVAGGTPVVSNMTGYRNFCSTDDGALRILNAGGGAPVTTSAGCQAYPVTQ